MRWLILGVGALGGYFGGRLLEAGQDVTFLLRPRRKAQIAKTGLVINSTYGDVHIPSPACVLAEEITKPYDVVVMACKAYDLDSAMAACQPAVDADTMILPLLNGMRHLDVLDNYFGKEKVLGGLCMISAALDEEGHICHFNNLHTLTYGERDGTSSERISVLEKAFEGTQCHAESSRDILQKMWEKWVLIATLAGTHCLLRASVGDIARAGGSYLVEGVLDECTAIAQKAGFDLSPETDERIRAYANNVDSAMTASMLKDVERGARIEGTHIIDDLIARAEGDIPTPLLDMIAVHLRAYTLRRERELANKA